MTENRHYKALELDKILAMLAEQTGCEDSRRLALEKLDEIKAYLS